MRYAQEMTFARVLITACFAAVCLIAPGLAQTLPEPRSVYVNDFADLLPPAAEARVADGLRAFQAEHGIELTLVTVETRSTYSDAPSIEAFATQLFNRWGIGDATRNDGILVLVARTDREMRIELGTGWPASYDDVAQRVIDKGFLPSFRNDDYALGIEVGMAETMRRFAPGAAGRVTDRVSDWVGQNIIFVLVGALGAVIARRPLADASGGLKRCPQCGRRRLKRGRTTLRPANETIEGEERIETTCRNCDYSDRRTRVLPRIVRNRNRIGGRFGGGGSSGGGASGRW